MTDKNRPGDATPALTGPHPDGLFVNTPDRTTPVRSTPNPTPDDTLFAEQRPAKRTPTPRPPRWRDEDMPLRPGDVIAVGLTHHRAVVGQVAAVNNHCFRLHQYSPVAEVFTTGVAVVAWSQVVEFGPVARKRGAAWLMQALLTWAENWQIQ